MLGKDEEVTAIQSGIDLGASLPNAYNVPSYKKEGAIMDGMMAAQKEGKCRKWISESGGAK